MEIIVIMCVGAVIGKLFFPKRWKGFYKGINEILQLICTLLLIFAMGVILGSRENFLQELTQLGWQSVIFFLLPTLGSILFVYPLTRIFLTKRNQNEEKKE